MNKSMNLDVLRLCDGFLQNLSLAFVAVGATRGDDVVQVCCETQNLRLLCFKQLNAELTTISFRD